ncbi:type VII secretion-associated serine protease mycosin [Streptomyces sp. NPDC058247]|uniref:type VII secretion-associated serine protease mycosin n=1 Tax=Streptomyces sp. NPDC058247 TaxID=3346401 RepID=UPI0036E6DAC1
MKADQMWQTSSGKGVTVAVIDTGVKASHPDLAGRVLHGKNLAPGESGDEQSDYDGHGTITASLIAGTGARAGGHGAFGLAPGAKILPVRLPRSGVTTQAEGDKRFNKAAAEAIRYAADEGAKVINISQGSPVGTPQLTEAVKYALGKGSLVFASSGNSGATNNSVEYPAATPGVVGVAAVGKDLKRTHESTFGPQVDMAAPGEEMLAACTAKSGLCESHGTSDATAIASASAALIWSEYPHWTNNQVLRVMLNTIGGPVDGAKRTDAIGYGIVRPRIALTKPGAPGPASTYPLPDFPVKASTAPSSPAPAAGHGPDHTTAAKEDTGNSVVWVGVGAGAVVLIGAVATLIVVRRRRAGATGAGPGSFGQFPPPGQPYGAPPQGGSTSQYGQGPADRR